MLLTLLTLLTLACTGEPPADEAIAQASTQVTFGTVSAMGPHRFEALVTRGYQGKDLDSTEAMELDWGDPDLFRVRRLRDGRLRSELRVIGGVAWAQQGRGAFTRFDDAELYRVELAQTWDIWGQALSPFQGRIQLVPEGEGVVEGRPVMNYRVQLAEGESPGRHQPQSLEGSVSLDQATALRVLGEVSGVYLENGRADIIRTVRIRLVRTGFGEIPVLEPPAKARGERKRRQRGG